MNDLVLTCGPIVLDRLARAVTVDGQPRHLYPKGFSILEQLLLAQGKILSEQQLIQLVWKKAPKPSSVPFYIHTLRRQLKPAGALIHTVRKQGYVLDEVRHALD
jgi:DNA-binding response OmpR family regulator